MRQVVERHQHLGQLGVFGLGGLGQGGDFGLFRDQGAQALKFGGVAGGTAAPTRLDAAFCSAWACSAAWILARRWASSARIGAEADVTARAGAASKRGE